MKVFWRVLAAFLVLLIVFLVFNFDRIQRLMRVNSMFAPHKIVKNFSNMDDAMFTTALATNGEAHDWPVALSAPPETVTIAGEALGFDDYLTEISTTALVVIKSGKIKFENYYQETTREDRRISWSVAKSFLSALFGIALAEGKIESLDDPVIKYVPELKGTAYENASIRNVLNMASGVKFNEDYYQKDSDINKMGQTLALGGSMDEFAASLKEVERPPGRVRQYVSIDTHVAGMVLRKATGKTAADYFTEKLWHKIGPGADGFYLTDGEKVAFVLGGLNMRTLDYALFGQLMLQKGRWKGERIIPSRWVNESTAISAPSPTSQDGFDYGYQWWIPEGSTGEYMASGVYGQQIYIDPKRNIVIAKNAAHIDFNRQSPRGKHYKREVVDLMRSLAEHYALAE